MAFVTKSLVALLMAAVFLCKAVHGGVYKVGDAAGWIIPGNVDYKQWSASKTFQLGDVIVFEYNPQLHNVMRVTHDMYRTCNTSAPLETHTSGNDSITINKRGHNWFICGFPGHCQAGQKVEIFVARLNATKPPVPGPSSTAFSPSVVLYAEAPAPAPGAAVSLKALGSLMGNLGLSVATAALLMVAGRFA